MQILIFILILSVMIFVHEGGHFLIGKKNGIGVEEFNIGFGPKIFSRKSKGTEYSLRLLPLGGACIFEGFDGEESDSPSSFINASVWKRISTVAAGPLMNFILAFFLSIFVIGTIGYDTTAISGTMEGFPAEEAGLKEGDKILSLNGHPVTIYRDISMYLFFHEGESVRVAYRRNGERKETLIQPKYSPEEDRFYLGILGGERVKGNALDTLRYSFSEVRYWVEITVRSLGMAFRGKVTKDDIAGPVGVAQVVSDVYEESKPDGILVIWLNMLQLTILFSADLGVMNLLPFPALDGGRLIFLLIEAVSGRAVDKRVEAGFHFVGMCCLMLLMVFVMYNDISRVFGG